MNAICHRSGLDAKARENLSASPKPQTHNALYLGG
jgi:hypothetical protein